MVFLEVQNKRKTGFVHALLLGGPPPRWSTGLTRAPRYHLATLSPSQARPAPHRLDTSHPIIDPHTHPSHYDIYTLVEYPARMSAATTLTTAFAKGGPHEQQPPTRAEVDAGLARLFTDIAARDKFASVGRCETSGKDITICYNTHGDPTNPCLLLVQGLATSLAGWPRAFIDAFVERGYYVVTYDNRDVGRSTSFREFGNICIYRFGLPQWASIGERLPYTLDDMAEDGMRLLTALGIERAHLFGMSMGGMLQSIMAIRHPERVLSLNIFCTFMGGRDQVKPGLACHARFIVSPRSSSVEDRARHMAWFVRFLSQGQYRNETDYATMETFLRLSFERSGEVMELANTRQIAALMRAPSRKTAMEALDVPTVVMHGVLDPLIPYQNAVMIAQAIKGSKLVLFPNLGHDFPDAIAVDLAEEAMLNMRRATLPRA